MKQQTNPTAGHSTTVQRGRAALTAVLVLLVAGLLYIARRALMPLAIGTVFAYIMLPFINWLDAHMRPAFRQRRILRTALVLVVYLLTVTVVVVFLGSIIPPVGEQMQVLTRRLPVLALNVYRAAPEVIQKWLDTYNEVVPDNIRLAIQHSFENTIQTLADTLQAGVLKGVNLLFTTLSFVIGLLVVPLWMFYILRDQPEINATFYRLLPTAYREDARHIMILIDSLLGAYLRGQLILCLSVGIMTTVGLTLLGVDLALLLGTLAGLFEVVPVLGPILGAIPAILITLAMAPANLIWVILLAFAVQQIENYVLVPQVARETVRIPPALSILVLIVGSEVAGVAGAVLSLPLTATIRDIAHYLYLRLSDQPLSPHEAVAHIRGPSAHPFQTRQSLLPGKTLARREAEETAAQQGASAPKSS